MSKNVTIRLDESIVRKCRHAAVEEDKSLSQWIADLMVREVSTADAQRTAKDVTSGSQ
jgi:predicted HicB family RNase H-like nuclease